MADQVYILQVGGTDWAQELTLPERLCWFHCPPERIKRAKGFLRMHKQRRFAGIFVADLETALSLQPILSRVAPYTIFYDQTLTPETQEQEQFLRQTCAQPVDFENRERLVYECSKGLFGGQYGDKFSPSDILVHPSFSGSYQYNGFENLTLEGDFGQDFRPLLNWRFNKPVWETSPNEFWLEYEKEGDLEIRLRLISIPEGAIADFPVEQLVSEADLQEAVIVDNDFTGYVSIGLEARGSGTLSVGALHARLSRYRFGKFTMGGRILSDQRRQEINYYFHPGDLKPPLAVYFSGFRTAEGFEGFGMMQSFKSPFILFQDPRLQGGAFYLGTEELEGKVTAVIRDHLEKLGFEEQDLILSGMSMGTFGAAFYGADFTPRAIILSKPLFNLGTIARDAKLLSPGVFPTSYDVLRSHTGGNSPRHIEALNQRFWDKFKRANFKGTTFAVAYMKDEDYDRDGFSSLLAYLYHSEAKLINQGYAGRHLDNMVDPVNWFVKQYIDILEREFGRNFK